MLRDNDHATYPFFTYVSVCRILESYIRDSAEDKFAFAQDKHLFILAALVGLMAGATAGPVYFTLHTAQNNSNKNKYRLASIIRIS